THQWNTKNSSTVLLTRSRPKPTCLPPMALCKAGHIYIVRTVLSRPPKVKFALCVCVDPDYFIWINTNPRFDGHDQLKLDAGCHELVVHDSHLDLSRVIVHSTQELEDAKE